MSSSQPILVCQSELMEFSAELTEPGAELSGSRFRNSTLETEFAVSRDNLQKYFRHEKGVACAGGS